MLLAVNPGVAIQSRDLFTFNGDSETSERGRFQIPKEAPGIDVMYFCCLHLLIIVLLIIHMFFFFLVHALTEIR